MEQGLSKLGPKGAAVVAQEFVQWVAEFCTVKSADVLARTYVAALAELPPDLAKLAVDRVKATYQFNKPPKPRDLQDAIGEELSERVNAKSKLLQANMFGRDPIPKPIQRDVEKRKAHVEAVMNKLNMRPA